MGMPDPHFASSGHKFTADRVWAQSGLSAKDMDVALIYDHFSPMVLMQLEDYGFCEKGEGNDYVLSGKLRYDPATGKGVNGGTPVNTRSEEHTSELQSLMRISYAVLCLKKKQMTSITHLSTNTRTHRILTTL